MAIDSYELAKTWASPDAGDALKFKWGTVVSIDADGMLNVRIAGYDSTVSCLNWAGADVGAIAGVLCKGSLWFAIASNGGGGRIAGLIIGYGGKAGKTPAGWLPCDGSTYNCADYPALYASIGRAYTASTVSADRFTVPNMGGRVALGANASYAVGVTGGSETQDLRALIGAVNNNIGALGYQTATRVAGNNYTYVIFGATSGGPVSETSINHTTPVKRSDNGAPSLMQPYTTVNYMISTGSGYDSTGNLITAEIADGAVTVEKLSPELAEMIGAWKIGPEQRLGISEAYKDGIYTCVKYDNGILEFFGVTGNVSFATPSLHPGASGWQYSAVNSIGWPKGLIEAPASSITPLGGGGLVLVSIGSQNTVSFTLTAHAPYGQTTSITRAFVVNGRGLWKPLNS